MRFERTKSALFFQKAAAPPQTAGPATSAAASAAVSPRAVKVLVLTAGLVLTAVLPLPPAEAKKKARRPRCEDVFASSRSPLEPYLNEDPRHPQAAALLQAYKIAQKRHWTGRKKELRTSEVGMLDFIRFLESRPAGRAVAPVSSEFLSGSLQKIPEIAVFANQAAGAEGIVFQQTVQAVFAVFGKILPAALKSKDPAKTNWGGLNAVLQSVAEFDIETNPAFSLYKIRRAVKRQWSLREFILCRR